MDALLVLLGVVVGAAATIGVEVVRVWAEARLDSTKRKDNRRLDRDTYQRQWLLALQDAVHDVTKDPSLEPLLLVWKLRARIADQDTRGLVDELLRATANAHDAKGSDADAAVDRVTAAARAVLDRTGALILATFEDGAK